MQQTILTILELLQPFSDAERRMILRAVSGRLRIGPALEGDRGLEALSPRQREVLAYLVDGWSNREVALALSITVKTVESHRESLMKKLNVHSMGELVRWAAEAGLLGAARRDQRESVSRSAAGSVSGRSHAKLRQT